MVKINRNNGLVLILHQKHLVASFARYDKAHPQNPWIHSRGGEYSIGGERIRGKSNAPIVFDLLPPLSGPILYIFPKLDENLYNIADNLIINAAK